MESLEGPHKEAEIQRKALRPGNNLAFSEDTYLEKERVRSKVTPIKVGVGLKRRRELSRRLGWKLAWWGSTEMKEASCLLGLRGRHQYSDQRSTLIRALRVAYTAVWTEGGGRPNDQIVSVKRAADGRRQRSSKIIDGKREKSTGPRTDPCGIPRRTRKERLL